MSGRSRNPIRDEDGKFLLADALHAKYNYLLECPSCGARDMTGGFNKSTAGAAGATNNRYRRYICRQKLVPGSKRCSKTISTTTFIELCSNHPKIGLFLVRQIQYGINQSRGTCPISK